jgi:V/A-type H+-transporting ATPase subunit C
MPLVAEDIAGIEETIDALERQGPMGARWAKVLRKVPSGSPLPLYEDALDRAYYASLLAVAKAMAEKGAAAMREFVRREIDARNLHNAARWANAGGEGDFSSYVIPGGWSLSVADVIALSEARDLDAFDERLQNHAIYTSVRQGLERARETRRIAPFAIAVETSLMGGLERLGHANPLSILPILTFLLRKRNEVATLRTLARGKAAGLSEDRLRELLP